MSSPAYRDDHFWNWASGPPHGPFGPLLVSTGSPAAGPRTSSWGGRVSEGTDSRSPWFCAYLAGHGCLAEDAREFRAQMGSGAREPGTRSPARGAPGHAGHDSGSSWRAKGGAPHWSPGFHAHRPISLFAAQSLYARYAEPLRYLPHWRPEDVEQVSPGDRCWWMWCGGWPSDRRGAMKIDHV
jgi:hypothetical protein